MFFKCLVEYNCNATWFFVSWEFFDYCFTFATSNLSIRCSVYPFYVYYYQLSYQTFTCQKDDFLCNFLYMYVHSPLPVLMWL